MAHLKYHLITYGCQMNKNDSERVAAVMDRLGFAASEKPEGADCIIINTCSVRQTAEDRVFGQMHNFAELKREKPDTILAVTGCMPGRDRDGKLREKLPMVDLFFPIADLPQLPRWIAGLRPEIAATADLADDYFKIEPLRHATRQAFVSISSGCDNYCTFCVVPYARGRERCRSAAEVLGEVRHLAERGCVEVTLLGQNVNTYHPSDPEAFSKNNPYVRSSVASGPAVLSWKPKTAFAALLWEINQIPGIARIHFTAPNPQDMTNEVIEALALPKQVNYLHLPVQAGSDRILKRMNRRYTAAQYLEIIDRVRATRPGIAIGTDIIVGFSGETEEEFEETLRLYRAADFDISYNAIYSSRSGTAAARFWKDDVPREEKKRRWNALQAVMEEIVLRKNQEYVGKTVEVLVDSNSQMSNVKGQMSGVCAGNSREMKRVQFPGSRDLVGQIVKAQIVKAQEWMLY
ncbi:MiaB/RimO family radical SAM methylthiotransferase, partial [Candidatus Uhrbacteria bacterium]|nr:MiaB/RimO family radical SAM methylthiotransferase [Candidatus Uhrbacteria bacterium]